MRQRFRYNRDTREIYEVFDQGPAPQVAPHVWSDIPEYQSPLGKHLISSRSARKEELKRNGCREIEPSEKSEIERITRVGEEERAHARAYTQLSNSIKDGKGG